MFRPTAAGVAIFLTVLTPALRAQTPPPSLDAKALQAAGVELTPAGVKAELARLASTTADDAYARRLLHAARWAGENNASECDKALLRCALRVRNPLARQALADAMGRRGARESLPDPVALANSGAPLAVLIAGAMLANTPGGSSADTLNAWAGEHGGWPAFGAARGLRNLGDRRYLAHAGTGLRSKDPMLRLAYYRLLDPKHRVAGYEVMGTPRNRSAALKADKTAPSPPLNQPKGFMLVGTEPNFVRDVSADGKAGPSKRLTFTPTMARRVGPNSLLMVAKSKFDVRDDAGKISYTSQAGFGPQNDVVPVGDGTWLVAHGGSFIPSLAERTSGLYVWSPVTRKVAWRQRAAYPLTVRLAQIGTLLIARGDAGLVWLDGTTGKDVMAVKFKAACRAAELLPSGDAIAAVGRQLVRVNPSGAVTWRVDLPGEATSLATVEELRYFVTINGKGLFVVDARALDSPVVKLLLPVPKGVCRIAGPL